MVNGDEVVSERYATGRNGFVRNTHHQGCGWSRETGLSHRHKNGGFRTPSSHVRRHLVGKDMMKAILELVGIFDRHKEMLTENSNKQIIMFRTMIDQALTRLEVKYKTRINESVLTEIFMEEVYCKNGKPCPVIVEFFHIIKTIGKYQPVIQDFGEYKKSGKNCNLEHPLPRTVHVVGQRDMVTTDIKGAQNTHKSKGSPRAKHGNDEPGKDPGAVGEDKVGEWERTSPELLKK